jgi:hypothetical protein
MEKSVCFTGHRTIGYDFIIDDYDKIRDQNLPPPPPWLLPEEERCVLEPPELSF